MATILDHATNRFLENDKYLLTVEANERSMTHKFAEYLQSQIDESWNVDCEYNRDGSDPKKIDEIDSVISSNGIPTTRDTEAKTVFPDIIIHKRGKDGENLLVIEAKKNPTPAQEETDTIKLEKIQEQYRYRFSVFLSFFVGEDKKDISWKIHKELV